MEEESNIRRPCRRLLKLSNASFSQVTVRTRNLSSECVVGSRGEEEQWDRASLLQGSELRRVWNSAAQWDVPRGPCVKDLGGTTGGRPDLRGRPRERS